MKEMNLRHGIPLPYEQTPYPLATRICTYIVREYLHQTVEYEKFIGPPAFVRKHKEITMKKNKIQSVITASVALLAGSINVYAGDYLSASEVTVLVSGKTFDGIHLKQDYEYRTYASPDGKVTQVKSSGESKTGKWSVLPNGKQCIEWDGTNEKKCYHIRDNGDGSYTKVKIKKITKDKITKDKIIPILRWKNFTQGNNLKL